MDEEVINDDNDRMNKCRIKSLAEVEMAGGQGSPGYEIGGLKYRRRLYKFYPFPSYVHYIFYLHLSRFHFQASQ